MLLQRRQRATARRPAQGGDPLIDQLVRDALIVRAEADLRWLDLCEERLVEREKTEAGVQHDTKRGRARVRSNRKAEA